MSGKYAEFIPLVVIVGAFWFFVLRPARRRQRAAATVQDTLAVGSRVMLTSGVFGNVVSIDSESFQLEISPGNTIEVHRQAVAKVVTPASIDTDGDS